MHYDAYILTHLVQLANSHTDLRHSSHANNYRVSKHRGAPEHSGYVEMHILHYVRKKTDAYQTPLKFEV